MSKKVCMVVAYHPFLDARIFKKEAKSLQRKGYQVSMIVPRKNGNLFDIDGTPLKNKFRNKVFTHEGIKIVTYHSESTASALSSVLGDESAWERKGFNNSLTNLAIQEDADIYHTHEYLSLFAGVGIKRLMKKRKGKDVKLIYDSHELTPDPLDSRYSVERREKLKEKLFIMLKEVDYIITVSDQIKSWYISHMPKLPTEVIYNSPPLAKDYQSKHFPLNSLTAGFEGNIAGSKGSWEKIFALSEQCSNEFNFHFKIIGGSRFGEPIIVPEALTSIINQTGWVDYLSIPKHMKDIDAGMIDFEDVHQSLNQDYALPNKFFSYLNNGVPVVVNKCHAMESFIKKYNCGYVINKKKATAEDFADAFRYLFENQDKLEEMSKNARNAMENIFSWEHMENRLFRVYEQVLKA